MIRVRTISTYRNTSSVKRLRPETSTLSTMSDPNAPPTIKRSILVSSLISTVLRHMMTASSLRLTESHFHTLPTTLFPNTVFPAAVRMLTTTGTTRMLNSQKSATSNIRTLQSAKPDSAEPLRIPTPMHANTSRKSNCMKLDTVLPAKPLLSLLQQSSDLEL